MFLERPPQQLVNGIILGNVYALLTLGYIVVYRVIKLINFAHGDIYMLGMFIDYYAIGNLRMDFWITLIFTMITAACLGMTAEFLAYRPLRHSTYIVALIAAIGVSFLLEYSMVFLVDVNTRSSSQAVDIISYKIDSVTVTNVRLLILIVSLVLMVALQLTVKKTRMGKAMRAVSVNGDAAELVEINVNSTISFTFALDSAPAGTAGVLIGLYYNSIEPLMGMIPGIRALVAAVLGGTGTIPGVASDGFVISILETLPISLNLSNYRDAIIYGILIIILLIRPADILDKNVKEKM